MMEMLFGLEEVDVVCCDERNAEFAADAFRFAQSAAVAGREMLHFDIEAVGEDVLKLGEEADCE